MKKRIRMLYAPDAGAGGGGGGQQQPDGGGSSQPSGSAANGQQQGGGASVASALAAAGGDGAGGTAQGGAASSGGDKGGQQQGQQGQQQNQQAQKPVIPERYEFKAPEGSSLQIDAKAIEAFSPIAKELGLSQEAFNKIAGYYAQQLQAQGAARQEVFASRVKAWAEESAKLPPETIGAAKRALSQLADDSTRKLFQSAKIGTEYGDWMGVHPGIIQLLAKAGALLKEDTPPGGANGGTGTRSLESLYK